MRQQQRDAGAMGLALESEAGIDNSELWLARLEALGWSWLGGIWKELYSIGVAFRVIMGVEMFF